MVSTAPAPAAAGRSGPAAAIRRVVTAVGVSPALLVALPLIVISAIAMAPHVLLVTDLTLIAVPHGESQPDSTDLASKIDATDVIFAAIGLIVLFRGTLRRARGRRRIPYLWLWGLYGVLTSLAYLYAQDNQIFLIDSVRIPFHLYRYCWKGILYLPVVALLIDDRKKLRTVFMALVLCADLCALYATLQSFTGGDPTGPFIHKNTLGGFLIVPMILSIGGFLYPATRREKRFFLLSIVLLTRGLICSGSRGATVATVGGIVLLCGGLLATRHGRVRLMRLAVIGLCLLPVGVVLKPDILERPNVQYLLEAVHPTEVDNYQWRKEERWPYFFKKMIDNPWLGVGTDTDQALGESCITPHNGYLSIGVISGIPALATIVLLALLTVLNGFRVFWRTADPAEQAFGLVMAASIAGLLLHNWVDATLPTPDIMRTFWLLVAVTAMVSRRADFFRPAVKRAAVPA